MGLDMYLYGKRHNNVWKETCPKRDGFPIQEETLLLGYWRKHPNLHGFIVREFAAGVDECQNIELDLNALRTILLAQKEDKLPSTQGFFFGTSMPEDKQLTIDQITKAIEWLESKGEGFTTDGTYYVVYRASW